MATAGQKAPGNKYGVYQIPDGVEERPACQAVLAGDVYEPDTIAYMTQNCGSGDVIHAGAFFGDFIPALSKALAPGARLWAFEPNPGNYAAARETIALNKLENVNLTNAALSNTEEQLLFRTRSRKGQPLGGLSRHVTEPGIGVEPVKAVMLDYHVPRDRPVSILQLDVEGHEKQALRGAYHLINRWRPILILEYFQKPGWLARTFPGLRYTPVAKVHANSIYVAEAGQT